MRKGVLTIVVPCYNEQETLDLFVEKMEEIQNDFNQVRIELLLVNDGSKDKTLETIKRLAQQHPDRIEYLSFSRNFGKEAGLFAGLQHAQGEWVAIMDADLQDPPEMLKEMYEIIQDPEVDVVATRRVSREGEPAMRSWFSNLFYKLNNAISDVKIVEGARDFRLMRHEVVESVISLPETNRFSKGIFSWVGYNVVFLEYPNIERVAGQTSWSFWNLFDYAVEGLISFSDFPLTLASYLGLFSFVIALIGGVYILVDTLVAGINTPGWASLSILILGMGGLQLLCLGVVGKYIGKIFIQGKNRPVYIVREKYLFNEESQEN